MLGLDGRSHPECPAGQARDRASRPKAPLARHGEGLLLGVQYHLPLAKPPKAMRPTSTMIRPSKTLHAIITTMPTMTRMPPRLIPPTFPPVPRPAAMLGFLSGWVSDDEG